MNLDFDHGVPPGDWTSGERAIRYQTCNACRKVWYFFRPFCPDCGSKSVSLRLAQGRGTVYAKTVVNRAPSEALAKEAPYCIVMVDASEGFRLMAHGDVSLQIGDSVTATFAPFGASLIPYFTATAK